MSGRIMVAWLACAVALGVVAAVPAASQAQTPDLRYRVAVKRSPTAAYKFFNGTQGVPTSVDVNGDDLADLVVELGGPTLKIARTPASSAPSDVLRGVQVEVHLPVPGQPGRVAAFGYDVKRSTAPRHFEADLTIGPGARQVGLVVRPTEPGSRLALIGAIAGGRFTDAPARWSNPIRGRFGYRPVPTQMSFAVEQQSADTTLISAGTTAATAVAGDMSFSATTGETTRKVNARLANVPSVVSVGAQSEAGELRSISYRGSAPIRRLTGFYEQRSGTTDSLRQARVAVADLPTGLDITRTGTTTSVTAVGGAVGVLDAGFAREQAVGPLPAPDPDFPARLSHTLASSGADRTTLRLVGLRSATVDVGDPARVELATRSVPFRATVRRGAVDVDAQIDRLPSEVVVTYSPAGKRFGYEGSAATDSIRVVARHATGWVRDARDLTVTALDVPRRLNASWPGMSDASRIGVAFDAGGDAIDRVEAILTNDRGTPLSEEQGFDGTSDNRLLIADMDERLYMRARLRGLRTLDLEKLEVPLGTNRTIRAAEITMGLSSTAPFRADVLRERREYVPYPDCPGPGECGAWRTTYREVRARMSRLAPQTTIDYVEDRLDDDRHTTLRYSATGGVRPSLSLSTSDRDASWQITVPRLPSELGTCLDTGFSRCSRDLPSDAMAHDADLSVTAAEPTDIHVFGCLDIGNCQTSWRPKNVVLVDIDSVQRLDLGFRPMEAPEIGDDEEGFIFIDTDPQLDPGGIAIDAKIYDGNRDGVRADVPAGFTADNRYVQGDIDVPADFDIRKQSGSAFCPGGTRMYVDIDDYWDIDLDEDVCTSRG